MGIPLLRGDLFEDRPDVVKQAESDFQQKMQKAEQDFEARKQQARDHAGKDQ